MSEPFATTAPPKHCAVDGCDRAPKKKGLCWRHYNQGPCRAPGGCPKTAKRHGLCWGHHKAELDGRTAAIELAEPRGAARDRAGLPRRSLKAQLIDAAIDLADANAEGDREAFDRAYDRLRMAGTRNSSPEQHPHLG